MPSPPKPPSDHLELRPIDPPIRASVDALLMGLPFLRRDGGHGVGHLALSLDAWADTLAREIGDDPLTETDAAAVAAWQARGAPTVGIEADLELAATCTLRLGPAETVGDTWGAAKVLRTELLRVHLRIPADRWAARPPTIPAGAWSEAPMSLEPAGDLADTWPIPIGHYPVSWAGFRAAKPQFAGVTTLEDEELDGYRTWRDGRGGTFDSLEWAFRPPAAGAAVDLLSPSSGVAIGDRARVIETPITTARGLAGRIGTVYGHTTPSLAYTTDVVGESAKDVAVGLALEAGEDEVVWLAAELIEFVDHAGATEIVVAGRRLTRGADGSWKADR